ncbi:MAG: Ni/Fe hydrogenase subunit alpha [Candidatus Bathyarchaeota archaeon]|nr:Ni/Fe hydrogenase subunit alpha [Candidatus Bathyarchaeota archaeon]MDH5595992.1 Ni/Fe hydrogenase subunit alpha [Candidatus Bathyarchaeota archaeon]
MSKEIVVEHVTRVEGHGGIEVTVEGQKVKDIKMNVFEGPRFFESFIEGVKYDKVPDVMRRICAICTAAHSLASIRTIEKAFKVEVTPQTTLLRDLLIHGEMVESHALHVFMLALPDYLGYPDAISMVDKYAKEVKAALQLKKAGNMIHITLSGREVHGMNERVGGFSTIPKEEDLLTIKKAMEASKATAELAVNLFSSLDIPNSAYSDNTLMALDPGNKFGYIGDYVLISNGERRRVEEYKQLTNEKVVKHSHAKHSSYKGSPFMVGALPRVLLCKDKLYGTTKELFNEHEDKLDPKNSLNNNLAQAIELVHCVDRCIEDIDKLLSSGLEKEELAEIELRESSAVGAVEAPRGILYHNYSFDESGCITKANVITPTALNWANIEKDFRVAAERLLAERKENLEAPLELIARAYDPCISCSVHLVKVKFL